MLKKTPNKKKYKNLQSQKKIVNLFLLHLSSGYSKDSFPECDYRTVEKMIQELKMENKLRQAERKCLKYWEEQGIKGMTGKIPFFNATTWIFNMKNRFSYADNIKITTDEIKIKFNEDNT